jgi:hypothetical protein
MAGLEETLALDVADALAAISEVEDRMTSAASTAESAFSEAFSSALNDAQAFAELAGEALGEALTSGAEAGGDSLAETLSQFDEVGVEVVVDSAEVEAVVAEVDSLSGTTDVTVSVDSSQVEEVVAQIDELATGIDVPVTVSADSGGTPAEAVGGVSTAAGVATGGIAGLNKAAGKLIPVWGQVAIAGAGVAAVTKTMFDYAVGAEAANKRLTAAYGDQVDALQDLTTVADLSPAVDTLKELTLATGSSGAGLKTFIANQAQLGIQSGATREQLLETGKGFGLLANYVSAARPELGTADQVAAGLAGALARGGKFAAKFGLDVGATADIAARAAEQYGKPTSELSLWEKQTAGLNIALERLGPTLGTTLDSNIDSPIIKMRSLERELKGVLSAAGEPLVDPLIAAMIALQPAVTGVAEVFGKFGGSVVPVLATALVPIADALGAVADLFAAIPGPLIGAAAAFYGVTRGAGMLLPLIAKIGPALSALSARIGLFATSIKFDGIVAAFGGVQKQVTLLSVANAKAAASSTALIAGLEAEGAATYGVTQAILAETAAMQASVALKAALVELGIATAEVAAANVAVKNGEVGAEARLTAALAAEAQAQAVVTAATTGATTARANAAAATGVVITGLGAEAGALTALSTAATTSAVASESAAASVAKAGTVASATNPLILALTVALGLAAAAWFVFGGESKKADDAIKEGKTGLADYRDSLNLTNAELANLDSASAQQQFREASGAAQEFYDSLGSDLTDDFNRLKLNLSQIGGALSGNKEDARALREQLIATGEVKIDASTEGAAGGIVDVAAQEAATAALKKFIETGELATGNMEKYEATLSPIAIKYLEQAKAAAELQEALETEAEAEIAAGNARDVSAIAALAASGQLGTLGEEAEVAARALLLESSAAEEAAAETTQFQVAATDASDATVLLLAAAQRASEALAESGAVGIGDLGAARALAASDAFAGLPKEVQDAVNAVIDFADAEVEAAQKAGELLTSLGEVAVSVVGLTENLGEAVDRFDALASSQATFNATNRDLASTVRDVDNQVGTLGNSLAGNAATFDAASINAKNYQDYLKLLTTEQQKAITDLEGTEEAKAAATAAAVKGSAEATEEATQIAKDNSDTLLDFFDGATEKIRTFGEEQLKAGKPVGEVNAAVGDQVTQLRDAALAAGISAEEFDAYLATVGVGVTGFSTEQLDTSGVTKLTGDLESLNAVIDLLPPETQVAIRAETDPEAQRALIEESLQGVFGAVNVAIKTYLAAPTPEEKLFALASIQEDPSFAVTAVVNLGVDPAQAAQAIATLNAYNNDPANAVKIVPTAETAAAIAGVNAVAEQAKAEIPYIWSPEKRAEVEAQIEKDRQTQLTVIANTEALDPIAAPVTKDVTLNVIIPPWATGLFPGYTPPGVALAPSTGGRSGGRQQNADRGKKKEQGGALINSVEYAAGGVRADEDVLRKLGEAGRVAGAPKPGRYGPGANITFAENGTAGEYFISRSITDRARNQGLIQAAAKDLGVNLAPQVTVNSSASAERQRVPSELVSAIASLADAQLAPPPPGQAPIAVGQINIQEARDAYQTADQVSDALAAEAFRRGSF